MIWNINVFHTNTLRVCIVKYRAQEKMKYTYILFYRNNLLSYSPRSLYGGRRPARLSLFDVHPRPKEIYLTSHQSSKNNLVKKQKVRAIFVISLRYFRVKIATVMFVRIRRIAFFVLQNSACRLINLLFSRITLFRSFWVRFA